MTSYMRSNLNVTMTCMINSTAVAMKYMEANSVNESNFYIPPECRRVDLSRGHINDYGVILFCSISKLLFFSQG